jgi:predicted N-acetyltransferase YhbS
MVTIRHERPGEVAAREALLDASYGPVRITKTSERLREGRLPELSLVAADGRRIVGSVRLWPVSAGRGRHSRCEASAGLEHSRCEASASLEPRGGLLLLGPLAVASDVRKRGIGSTLVQQALREAGRLGHGAVLLVGDAPYYGRFGFSSEKTGALWLPGPYERHRLLGVELVPGALDGARGLVRASGQPAPRPDLAALVAGLARNEPVLASRAA